MEMPIFTDVLVTLALSAAALFVCHRLRVPTVLGFILAGVVAGPHGFGLVTAVHEVEALAEVGIVLLLFALGLEFSFQDLLRLRRPVLVAGPLQVGGTLALTTGLALWLGWPAGRALFAGMLMSLSSTAIVLRQLHVRGQLESAWGRTGLGVLIFQDLAIFPMILLTPTLAAAAGGAGMAAGGSAGTAPAAGTLGSVLVSLLQGAGVIAVVVVGAKLVVPRLLYQVARTRDRELFVLSIVVIGFAVAWCTAELGLSLSLGAFLAGLLIGDSPYSHQALSHVTPFRDVFMSFFFVSVGMLLDVEATLAIWPVVLLGVVAIVTLKTAVATAAVVASGFPLRIGLMSGMALFQVGEFSFLLSQVGLEHGLIAAGDYQAFLAVSLGSMMVTPFVLDIAPRLSSSLAELAAAVPGVVSLARLRDRLWGTGAVLDPRGPGHGEAAEDEEIEDHLVIVGFGINGRNLAQAARMGGIPYRVVETNPDTVREERAAGEPIRYGDASQEEVLRHVGIERARVLVITVADPTDTRRIVEVARRLDPGLHVIARTRFVREVVPLLELGADEVIPEEFETSIQIFTRVLRRYLVPEHEIQAFLLQARASGYEPLRRVQRRAGDAGREGPLVPGELGEGEPGRAAPDPETGDDASPALDLHPSDLEVATLLLDADSPIAGRSLRELDLRKRHGLTLLAIRRDGRLIAGPGADTDVRAGDLLFLLGSPGQVTAFARLAVEGTEDAPGEGRGKDAPGGTGGEEAPGGAGGEGAP